MRVTEWLADTRSDPGYAGFKALSNGARSLLDRLLKNGGASQAALTADADLSQPQVARLLHGFHDDGMVRFSNRIAQGRGNPSVQVTLNPDFAYGLGVAMLGDSVSLTLLDFAGRARATRSTAMPSMAPRRVIQEISKLRRRVIDDAAVDPSRIVGAGVGFSGFYAGTPPRFSPPDKLDAWFGLDVASQLAAPLGVAVVCDNDGITAAIAESLLGIGRTCKNFAYLHFANGFGGGLIVEGKAVRGHLGNAGEFGGVLWLLDDGYPNLDSLRDVVVAHGTTYATVEDMVHGIDVATPGVAEWLRRAQSPIGKLAFILGYSLAPEKVVIGGRLPKDIAQALARSITMPQVPHRNDMPFPLPQIVATELDGDAVAIGAALMPLQQQFFL